MRITRRQLRKLIIEAVGPRILSERVLSASEISDYNSLIKLLQDYKDAAYVGGYYRGLGQLLLEVIDSIDGKGELNKINFEFNLSIAGLLNSDVTVAIMRKVDGDPKGGMDQVQALKETAPSIKLVGSTVTNPMIKEFNIDKIVYEFNMALSNFTRDIPKSADKVIREQKIGARGTTYFKNQAEIFRIVGYTENPMFLYFGNVLKEIEIGVARGSQLTTQ